MNTTLEKDKNTRVKCNATLYWCYHSKPAAMSDKYEVTLGNLSSAAVEALQQNGLKVNSREDKPELGNYIIVRSTKPLRLYHNKEEVSSDTIVANGTTAVVIVAPYNWEYKNKKGTSPTMVYCDIQNLVEYKPAIDNSDPL